MASPTSYTTSPQGTVSAVIALVTVTVLQGAFSGKAAHGLSGIPKPFGQPNPDNQNGVGAIVTTDATWVYVTMPNTQGMDINFTVGVSL